MRMRKASGDLATSSSPAGTAAGAAPTSSSQQPETPARHPLRTPGLPAQRGRRGPVAAPVPKGHACPSTHSQATMSDAQFPLPAPRRSTCIP